jgi:hypothetical protein
MSEQAALPIRQASGSSDTAVPSTDPNDVSPDNDADGEFSADANGGVHI